MMSGELEFEDIFYGENEIKYPVTSHIMFFAFVMLVTVILTNLLVGLAVSDIQVRILTLQFGIEFTDLMFKGPSSISWTGSIIKTSRASFTIGRIIFLKYFR